MILELIEEIEIEKLASEKVRNATVDPGWLEGQHATVRAMRAPGSVGIKKVLADPKLVGMRMRKDMGYSLAGGGIGLAAGAGIGAIIGAMKGHAGEGAAIGAMVGGMGGSALGSGYGVGKADQEFLAERGIQSEWAGLKNRLTPAAAGKYLPEKYDKRGKKKTSADVAIEKLAQDFLDDLAIEWLEKDAGMIDKGLARLGSSAAAMREGIRSAGTAAKNTSSGPNPSAFKQTTKSVLKRTRRLAGTRSAKSRTSPVTGTYGM